MTANSLSEGYIDITYASQYGVSHQKLPVNYAGTPTAGVEPDLTQKDTTTVSAISGLAAFILLWKVFFDDTTNFGLARAYTVDPETEESTFIFAWNIGVVGTGATPNVKNGEMIMTWITGAGGLLKLYAMQGIVEPEQAITPPYIVDSAFDDINSYMVSGDCIVIGRDNAYPFAPISMKSKINDVLRKRRFF